RLKPVTKNEQREILPSTASLDWRNSVVFTFKLPIPSNLIQSSSKFNPPPPKSLRLTREETARKLGHRGIMTGEALQISPANDPRGSPAKEQQAAGVGIILQIMMLVLSFVLGHVLRRHKFYYLPEASASLLICLIVGALANISNTETNIRTMSLVRSHASSGQNFFMSPEFRVLSLCSFSIFLICQRDGTCTAGCVLQEKEGLLEPVEKGKIAARTEKRRQIASIESCSRRDENPAVGAHKKCDRELFLLIFQDMYNTCVEKKWSFS
ncbi:hypothetical protein CUMW_195340, partial [Citrus unshiu]